MNDDSREKFVSDLGNPYANPKSNDLELLFQYIEKENEIVTEFDKEDGIDVEAEDYVPESMMINRLSAMEDYRIAKTLLANVKKMITDGLCHRNPQMVNSLDRDQRQKHNRALTSLMAMNEFAKKEGLPEIYTGKLIDKHDIVGLGTGNLDARIEMTNFFLGLLTQISKYNVRELKNDQLKKQIKDVQKKMDSTNSTYKVKKELTSYDGEIEFYD